MTDIDIFREYLLSEPKKHNWLGNPASEHEIAEFETHYRLKLPDDIKEYFLKINGFSQNRFVTVFELAEWKPLPELEEQYSYLCENLESPEKYFRFGHYDIHVWHWLIRFDANVEQGTSIFMVYMDLKQVASSFTEFLNAYKETSGEVL